MPERRMVPRIDADDIVRSAKEIRDVVQRIIDACEQGKPIDDWARSKVASGHLAGDAASLGIMVVAYEMGAGNG